MLSSSYLVRFDSISLSSIDIRACPGFELDVSGIKQRLSDLGARIPCTRYELTCALSNVREHIDSRNEEMQTPAAQGRSSETKRGTASLGSPKESNQGEIAATCVIAR